MPRPKLSSPDQPFVLRLLLQLYELLASLKLAVVVIGLSAVVLAWATFVEMNYGAEAVRFGVYRTWWFSLLISLLGLNVFCAALIRFPWQKHQTGFVVTHLGILVLLVGCFVTRLGGVDAQLPVFEGHVGHVAYQNTQHFELEIVQGGATGRRVTVPFSSGPFNWSEYGRLFFFPWRLTRCDRGVLYDRHGIRLEVLDYLRDSRLRPAGPLRLRVRRAGSAGQPRGRSSTGQWTSVELNVRLIEAQAGVHSSMVLGDQQRLPGGEAVSYSVAVDGLETRAFLESQPTGPVEGMGLVVLCVAGQRFELGVDQLARGPQRLGATGVGVELVAASPQGIQLRLTRPAEGKEGSEAGGGSGATSLFLLADSPHFNHYDRRHGVYGTLWAPPAAEGRSGRDDSPAEAPRSHYPRVDILQGSDGRLYYRVWRPPRVEAMGRLKGDGRPVEIFGRSGRPLRLVVEDYQRHDLPGWRVEPVPSRQRRKGVQTRRARVRLTVDGHVEEFWLQGMGMDVLPFPPELDQLYSVPGQGRVVKCMLRWDTIDVGFGIYLHQFRRKLDPGTDQASHYSSLVDLRARPDPQQVLPGGAKVLIDLNQPKSFRDPITGRTYRLYQEAFRGPWKPGDVVYERMMQEERPREQLFMSILTVNYDPGRGLKYLGSLLIVAGIGIIFYMRAYFFRPRGARPGEQRDGQTEVSAELESTQRA